MEHEDTVLFFPSPFARKEVLDIFIFDILRVRNDEGVFIPKGLRLFDSPILLVCPDSRLLAHVLVRKSRGPDPFDYGVVS